ncbi:MAG: PfkB family carbohydrate kinase [Rubrivivax sp.]
MTLLVAGSAAMLDLLLAADRVPASSEVASLAPNPCTRGEWLPGGAALTIALATRAEGLPTRLWHPLPALGSTEISLDRLERAGVDLSFAPRVADGPARCVMVYAGDQRLAWSTRLLSVRPTDLAALFDGISHLVIAPAWGDWAEMLVSAAGSRGIPCSLIGEAAPETLRHRWHTVVVDESQFATLTSIQAQTLVVTCGAAGAIATEGETRTAIRAQPVAVVDTTGAGDTFGGTLLARRLRGDSIAAAGEVAAMRAARACAGWGASAAFDVQPSVARAGDRPERVRGALAGMACGDAFGMPNSFLTTPPWRRAMEPGPAESPYHAGYPAGRITDDTEQALALTAALEDGWSIHAVAQRLHDWFDGVGGERSLAVGPSTRRAMIAYAKGEPVDEIGRDGVTNGAAMRIAPVGVFAALAGLSLDELVDQVVVACVPTHATAPAIAGAAAIAAGVAAAVEGASWEGVIEHALAGAAAGATRGRWVYAADVAARIRHARQLLAGVSSPAEVARLISDVVGAGEATTESVPAAIAIADHVRGDPQRAIEIAGNLRGDTDTIAAMAGALCGAHAGEAAIDRGWRERVGRVNALDIDAWAQRLERAAARWPRPAPEAGR